ncbi:cysteine-rich RLK (RECEPTOR-like protein kinase) 26 [Artemisia annua]|uniref:Cysteine-rich RLK (RECEPTOR-like protein kinase) 26 n=1 Tax=Artemisia annua TaxID=35608 RepID=A0A2U1LLS9_ARTAN|nr:cysteine-rich RLK (RECEPTOR-like protein kinase) 26 [Artemisia annua]
MFILTGKLPFAFLFSFLYLVNTITLAQPEFTSHDCFNTAGNYTRNSPYQRNLNTTLSALPNTNSGFGFFNTSTGQGSDTVHSLALCRGDANLDACRSCLNDSVVKLREICPNKKQAIGYYDLCMLIYSNQTVLRNTNIPYTVFLWNTQNASDVDRFNDALSPLLNNLIAEASGGGSLRKFASGNTSGPGVTRIYALAQCTPDLNEQQCDQCLQGAISQFTNAFSGKIGGRALVPMCNFRMRKKHQQTPEVENTETETMDIGTAESLQYGFSLVKSATNDFAEDNKLGQGGFGAVYKLFAKE